MNNKKHTKGQWKLYENNERLTVISRMQPLQPFQICEMNKHALPEVNEANAKLIAAAPTMLDTLQSCLSTFNQMVSNPEIEGMKYVVQIAIKEATV